VGLPSTALDAVVDCRDVTVVKGGKAVVSNLTWQVTAGQRWVVIGPNGAGKSSLLDVVSARAHPTAGQVLLLGEPLGLVDVFALRPRIGLVATTVAAAIPAQELVRDVVLTAVYGMTGRWREDYEDADLQRALALLAGVGIGDLAERRFGTLSDGERKRVLIARALMPDPEVLVLDEPAAGLDLGAREQLLHLLSEIAADPQAPAVVLVTHHVEEVPVGFTHALLLAEGQVVASGPLAEVLTGDALGRTFGIPITVGRFAGRFFAVATRADGGGATR
jgi:iron complex transport system ATP-binding protein